jgi:hypothetical protein
MFARIKKSGKYQYLQIVENRKIKGKVKQRVIATIGRMDRLQAKDQIETLIRSLSRFSEKALLVLSGKSDVIAHAKKIGPALIFERLWEELGIKKVIKGLLSHRKFEFHIERAIFLTVVHRLFVSGSDRSCEKWKRDYKIDGVEGLSLHHLYRAMRFLGEPTEDQTAATPFSPRCTKDLIEEGIFLERRDLFTGLDLVFFDTTSIYFEGSGGEVIPVIDRVRSRFYVGQFCIVADRGMISAENVRELEQREIPYIFGARMRKVKEIREDVLSHPGRYREVRPEGSLSKDPAPLKVKEVVVDGKRYIVCLNARQARKPACRTPASLSGRQSGRDARDRQAITDSILETKPVYHQKDENIRGHVFFWLC